MPRVRVDADLAGIMPRYLELARQDAAALLDAAQRGGLDTARLLGHRLKGTGTAYGLAEISRLGREIEASALAGKRDAALDLAWELSAWLAELEVDFTAGEETGL